MSSTPAGSKAPQGTTGEVSVEDLTLKIKLKKGTVHGHQRAQSLSPSSEVVVLLGADAAAGTASCMPPTGHRMTRNHTGDLAVYR
ncbi:hypothetical protein D623_10010759 [Myotis brandtii]|uniref:Uncharacterized protein n=1 Tax=Myotis brandtii TaxID=109478 RepID=S7PP64_MYOBR|nr:hypothetical protein D623_10010759 [Myotis brandtii]